METQGTSDQVEELTPNQVVAYNLRQARELRGWTQVEAAEHLEPHLGARWSEAVFSAAERSVDGKRVREFTADDLVALSRAFELPISYFLLPPAPTHTIPGSGAALAYIADPRSTPRPEGAFTTTVAIKTPAGALPTAGLLARLLALDEATSSRLRILVGNLPVTERQTLYSYLEGRDTALATARLGDLGKHARELRQAADLLDDIRRDLKPPPREEKS